MVSSAPALAAPPAGVAPPPRDPGRRWVLLLAAVAALAALAFPFAPVSQPQVTYDWDATDGAAAIPLMPYQAVALTVTTNCDTVRAAAGSEVFATVPSRPDPAALPLGGLHLEVGRGGVADRDGTRLDVTSAGLDLGTVTLPPGPCTIALRSDPSATRVAVDGVTVLTRTGDVRPDVAGAFADGRDGVHLTLVADTRFQTTITPVKTGLAVVAVLALLGLLVALGRLDRAHGRAVALLPRGWWRPRPVDLVVVAVLGGWWVVGALTVDDGYISGIVRSRGENGVVGNVYRWLNAPESPFSWYDDVLYGWSRLSVPLSESTVWMRLPAVLLGVGCWALLSRALLPRLLPRHGGRVTWAAALALLTWWVPLNVGLRPEPWVATGLLVSTLAVERAIATRRVRPLVVGLVAAGVTTALTPGGLIAIVPFLAGLGPVLRLLHARRDLHGWPLTWTLVAAPASALLLMLDDQGLGPMLEAVRVRNLIGGGLPWYGEYQRYANLLSATDFQGSIERRTAVLATLLAVIGVLWAVRRRDRVPGVAHGPVTRLALGVPLALAIMTFTPTKWSQHFGDLGATGAGVLAVALVVFARPLLRPPAQAGALAAVTVTGALVLAGENRWPFVSVWFTPTFSTEPPQVGGVLLCTALLVVGLGLVAWLVGRDRWARATDRPEPAVPPWLPGPAPVLVVLLVAVLILQVGGFSRTALAHRDSYTMASDTVATLRGDPCGLQRDLGVETDPAAGLLTARTAPAAPDVRPVDIGGASLPGIGIAGRVTTAWFALDPRRRAAHLPVVVTTAGTLRPGDSVVLQFGGVPQPGVATRSGDRVVSTVPVPGGGDLRAMAPSGSDSVRIVVDAAPTPVPASVSLPRMPVLTPMEKLLPRGTAAILDWPIAFVFPCLNPASLPLGTASLPAWRVGPPLADPSGAITYAPGFGGPFASARLLVTEQRLPTYLAGDPTRDAVQVYRWVPVEPLTRPAPSIVARDVPGWVSDGRTRVPGLDPVGR